MAVEEDEEDDDEADELADDEVEADRELELEEPDEDDDDESDEDVDETEAVEGDLDLFAAFASKRPFELSRRSSWLLVFDFFALVLASDAGNSLSKSFSFMVVEESEGGGVGLDALRLL